MDTLTYARPDSTLRFHRLALGALILTLVPIIQLIWRWIVFPLLVRFAPAPWLQSANFLPYMFGTAILLVGICVISTTFQRTPSNAPARVAVIALATLYFMTSIFANGIVLGAVANHLTNSFTGRDMLHASWVASAIGSLILAIILIFAMVFMFRIAQRAEARWVGGFGVLVLSLSVLVVLLNVFLYLFVLVADTSSSLSIDTFKIVDLIGRIASLIHQLAELLLWSTITLWALRRTSA